MDTSPEKIQQLVKKENLKYILPFLILLIAYAGCIGIGDGAFIHDYWGVVLWVISLMIAIRSLVDVSYFDGFKFPWKTAFICLILFNFAFFMRAIGLDHIPFILNGDEGSSGLDAVEYLIGIKDNIFVLGWFSFPNLHTFIQSFFIRLLGRTIVGVRMSSVVIGALTVPVLYVVAKRMFSERIALVSAAFLSVLPLHVHMSRIGLNNIWDPFCFLVMVGFFWDGWKNNRAGSFVLAGLGMGLSQYFYVTSRAMIPLSIAILIVLAIIDRKRTRELVWPIVNMYILAVVVMMPLYYFYALHPSEFQAPMARVSIFDRGWLDAQTANTGTPAIGLILNQFFIALKGLVVDPIRGYYDTGTPVFQMPTALIFMLGFILMVYNLVLVKFRDERPYILVGWSISILFSVALSVDVPTSQRYVAMLPALSIIAAYGLCEILDIVAVFTPKYQPMVYQATLLLTLILVAKDAWYYLVTYPEVDILGGVNGLMTNDFANYLNNTRDPQREVIFYGYPNMGYDSIPSLPFLVSDVKKSVSMGGHWGEAPETPKEYSSRLTFFFSDLRVDDLELTKRQFPGGYTVPRCLTSLIWNGCYYIYEWRGDPLQVPYQLQPSP